ncbi:hypothetical protein BB559_004839 [Furculomyces boomerangus]|uniref:Septicolysin n=2 Tax=Harpellales TaxID=61421 RepID=A0A2T9YCD2_9FUNG|nr:hypothetical protein BB559_004839 [Furculomyces boomerangus]PVZ98093.1 hypothetical protein BB558_005910 [Smittium angustum]
MKLAEALIIRTELDKSIKNLEARIISNSLIQEGSKVLEDPNVLLQELYEKIEEHKTIVTRINATNLNVKLNSGISIMEGIVKRDVYLRLYNTLNTICNHANEKIDRYSKTEILNIATIDVAALRKKMDMVAKQRREIDIEIQSTNWIHDLI